MYLKKEAPETESLAEGKSPGLLVRRVGKHSLGFPHPGYMVSPVPIATSSTNIYDVNRFGSCRQSIWPRIAVAA